MNMHTNLALIKVGSPSKTAAMYISEDYGDDVLDDYMMSDAMLENGWREFKQKVQESLAREKGREQEKVKRMRRGERETREEYGGRSAGQSIGGGLLGGLFGLGLGAALDRPRPGKGALIGGALGVGVPAAVNLIRGPKSITGSPERVRQIEELQQALESDNTMESQAVRKEYKDFLNLTYNPEDVV